MTTKKTVKLWRFEDEDGGGGDGNVFYSGEIGGAEYTIMKYMMTAATSQALLTILYLSDNLAETLKSNW